MALNLRFLIGPSPSLRRHKRYGSPHRAAVTFSHYSKDPLRP